MACTHHRRHPLRTGLGRTIYLLCAAILVAGCSQSDEPAAQPTVAPVIVTATPKRPPTVTAYNGLLYAEMGPLTDALRKAGAKVTVMWHDEQRNDDSCPDYILGHSMGGNAALRQAVKCIAAKHPPKAVISIDAGRAPLFHQCPPKIKCVSYYNPLHPIGGQSIDGAENIVVSGIDHLYMPDAPAVVRGVLALVK